MTTKRQNIKTTPGLLLPAIHLCLCILLPSSASHGNEAPAPAPKPLAGANDPGKICTLAVARFGLLNGNRVVGTYHCMGNGKWKEIPADPNGNDFKFIETARDKWSVYLHDPSRDVRIQIDLHTKKIYYSDANTPRREQYKVLSSWSGMLVNFCRQASRPHS